VIRTLRYKSVEEISGQHQNPFLVFVCIIGIGIGIGITGGLNLEHNGKEVIAGHRNQMHI
jgi:hypothetical protein